eukprot:TRINITY_DN33663_c0_g1_i1.p1 TRINITY_DN33663_c0_g1~~TRINITY_DN33663_c0_g1_i1.p1  ORF type:complete len:463 (+),score=112.42 TRINITY_DN33663_c0_g1_i1:91-1479(+)
MTVFEDGGAFPEIHRKQYPLGMGRPGVKSNALAVTLNAKGEIDSDALVRSGQRKGTTTFGTYLDLVPKDYDDDELARPTSEELTDAFAATRKLLEAKLTGKVASLTGKPNTKQDSGATIIKYNASETTGQMGHVPNRVIRMVEAQKDPLDPSRSRVQKAPAGPPPEPAPILHSPTKRASQKDMQDWKVPPMVSNWINPKGYTLPLEQRLKADGRGLQEVQLSEGFATFASAMDEVERTQREEVDIRININKKLQAEEENRRMEELRRLAQKAKSEKEKMIDSGITDDLTREERQDLRERERIKDDRRRNWERERRIAESRNSGRGQHDRELARDIGEKIAIGQSVQKSTGGVVHDQRLYAQGSATSDLTEDGGAYTKSLMRDISKSNKFKADRTKLDEEHRRQAGALNTNRTIAFEAAKGDPYGLDHYLDDINQEASSRVQQKRSKSVESSFSSESPKRKRK